MRKSYNKSRFKSVIVTNMDEPVQSGLSLTPAEMWSLAQQGKPISAGILSDDYFDDGRPTNEVKFEDGVPLERRRGIDVADVWQQSMSSKKKIKNAYDGYTSRTIQRSSDTSGSE